MIPTFERVTFREEGARRNQIVFLRNPRETTVFGAAMLTGVRVNNEGDEIAPHGVDQVMWILDLSLVTNRTPVEIDLKYGVLVPVEKARIGIQPAPQPKEAP